METSRPRQPPSTVGDRLEGASRARILSIIATVALFSEIAPMQYTMVFAAIPQIAPSFPDVGANISWIIIVFLLVGGALTPIMGKMSDLWGKKRLLLVSGAAFAAGTLICALARSWPLFLVGRGVEALGLAAQTVAFGLFRDILPRRYVPVGIGMIAAGSGIGFVGGPLLAGWLLEEHSWRALFWLLLIFVGVTLPLLVLLVPESKLRVHETLDVAGATLLAAGVGFVLVYLSNGATWGWGRITCLAYLIGGLLLLIAFLFVERTTPHPLVDLRLLQDRKVFQPLLIGLFGSIAAGILVYAVPYMMQSPTTKELTATITEQVRQTVPEDTPPTLIQQIRIQLIGDADYALGMTLLEYATHSAVIFGGFTVLAGALTGMWSRRIGLRLPLIAGLVSLTVAAALFSTFTNAWWQYSILSVALGVGLGALLAAPPNLVVEAVPETKQGSSAGMLSVFITLGASLGTAVFAAFQAANPLKFSVSMPGTTTNPIRKIPQAFDASAYHYGMVTASVAAGIGLIIAIIMHQGRTPTTGGADSY
ncbi:MFS transporter [Streptomyces sp. NPDC126514]|uniref:MFS transporter n=1 Tax=Streptomyces sp. NPDC126514 TaxID=3155210 RepID=UPI00332C0E66